MFDLPVSTAEERRSYRRFRKNLLKAGYCAVQESVYVKLLRSSRTVDAELLHLKLLAPDNGKVLAMPMPLAQFKLMTAIRGAEFDFSLFSDDIVYVSA